MEIAKIEIGKTTGVCTSRRRIPAGIVGATVSVVFKDPVWDDLTKTVVFRGKVSRVAEFDGTVAVIPGDIVSGPGVGLHFGIWGQNSKTGLQLPLIEIPIGITEKATDPQADPSVDPGLPIWAQLQQDIEELKNAGVGKPGEKGEQGDPGEDGGWYTPAVTRPDKNTIEFAFTPSKDGMPAVEPGLVELPDSGENIEEHNTDPYSHADIRKRLSAANIVESASGDVIAVSDSSDMELTGLRICGKTTQDGTPTPEAPVPLESVGDDGSVGVTVAGKNLFDYVTAYTGLNSVAVSGNVASGFGWAMLSGKYIVPPELDGKTLTCQAKIKSVYETDTPYIAIRSYNPATQMEISSQKVYANKNYETVTFSYVASAGEQICASYGGVGGNAQTVYIKDFQIEIGETATEYEPYHGQNLTVSTPNGLPGIPVSSGGNYTDENGQQWICDEVDFTKGVYIKRIVSKVLDGTEPWEYSTTSSHFIWRTKNRLIGISAGLSSHYGKFTYNDFLNADEAIYFPGNSDWVSIRHTSTEDVSVFAEFLRSKNISVQYILAGEEIISLSAEELAQYAALHTNYPNTTIFNDGGAGMEVQYVADTKLYVDKKFTELSAALLNQ